MDFKHEDGTPMTTEEALAAWDPQSQLDEAREMLRKIGAWEGGRKSVNEILKQEIDVEAELEEELSMIQTEVEDEMGRLAREDSENADAEEASEDAEQGENGGDIPESAEVFEIDVVLEEEADDAGEAIESPAFTADTFDEPIPFYDEEEDEEELLTYEDIIAATAEYATEEYDDEFADGDADLDEFYGEDALDETVDNIIENVIPDSEPDDAMLDEIDVEIDLDDVEFTDEDDEFADGDADLVFNFDIELEDDMDSPEFDAMPSIEEPRNVESPDKDLFGTAGQDDGLDLDFNVDAAIADASAAHPVFEDTQLDISDFDYDVLKGLDGLSNADADLDDFDELFADEDADFENFDELTDEEAGLENFDELADGDAEADDFDEFADGDADLAEFIFEDEIGTSQVRSFTDAMLLDLPDDLEMPDFDDFGDASKHPQPPAAEPAPGNTASQAQPPEDDILGSFDFAYEDTDQEPSNTRSWQFWRR